MEYRKLTPAEAQQAAFIAAQAFDFSMSREDLDKYLEEGSTRHVDVRGAVDEEGRVLAGMILNPYKVWFDGHIVGMGGIGGVSTLPEYRRGGHIRGIFRCVMDEMRERGMVFSFLYPFSHIFYRKFGYEVGSMQMHVEAPTDQLARYAQPGRAVQYQLGMDLEPFMQVDKAFAPRHNMMADRPLERWKRVLEHDPLTTKIRTYVLYNAEDKPVAWFQFTAGDHVMNIREMEWTDRQGLWAMLGFWGRFAGNYNTVTFHSSPELVAEVIWSEPHPVKTTWNRQGMNRVVDVQRALELMKKPAHPGEVILRVQDEFCGWNDKTFRVAWEAGESRVDESSQTPDMTVSVQALSQMVTGLYPLEVVASRMDVQIDSKEKQLARLFPQKKVLCQEHF